MDVWTQAEVENCGYISVISLTNIFYIVGRIENHRTAYKAIHLIRDSFNVVHSDQRILQSAMDAGFDDFEDAIQYYSAIYSKADCLITRNAKHFPSTDIPILSPAEFISSMGAME